MFELHGFGSTGAKKKKRQSSPPIAGISCGKSENLIDVIFNASEIKE